MKRPLNPELALGFLIATVFWIGVLGWQASYTPPDNEKRQCEETAAKSGHKTEECKTLWERTTTDPVAFFTFVLSISTIGLWIVTWRASASQARDMKASIAAAEKSGEIARDAMIAGERAFVFTTGATPYWELDQAGLYNWRFRPSWKNSGDTPTKNMTMHTECMLRDSVLPVGFDFDYTTTETGTALIPPNTSAGGGLAPRYPAPAITPQDILDVQAGKKFLYFMGWAKYFDVFPGTPQHITRFCWQLMPLGNPLAYDPTVSPQNLTFPNIYHTEGNCADDECEAQ
jgi:hypothetical protein